MNDESPTLFIDEEAQRIKGVILKDPEEMDDFFRRSVSTVEQLARLIVMHWENPVVMGYLIKEQVETDIAADCISQAREELA